MITYQYHLDNHVANHVLAVGCDFCKPEIERTYQKSKQNISEKPLSVEELHKIGGVEKHG